MNRAIQRCLLLRVATGGLAVTTPAFAQDTESSLDSPSDIIVTARRTEERLQDVPISITVLTPQALTDRNIVQPTDLATYTPGLSVNQRFGPERATFSIRGFTQDPGTSPSVGVYFAEVPGIRVQGGSLGGNTLGPGVFMDLQNVQVLKGPQGTLFGRNTTGGAILLVPNKPTGRFEGWVEGQLGNYDMHRLQAVVNVPVTDSFKARFAVDRNKRDGYMRNHSGIGPADFNDTDYLAIRGSILANFTPNLENTLLVHYSKTDTNGYAGRILSCNRNVPLNPTGASSTGLTAAAACDQIDRQVARGDGLLDVEVYAPGGFLLAEQWQIINTTTWDASDTITVKNIASYGQYRERSRISTFSENFRVSSRTPSLQVAAGGPITPLVVGMPFLNVLADVVPGQDAIAKYAATEELQIQGRTEHFNWVVGAYGEFNRQIGLNTRRTLILLSCTDPATLQCTDPFGLGSASEAKNKYDFDSYGFFGEGTYNFTDQLALTLGARYTFDKARAQAENSRIVRVGTSTQARQCTDTLRFRSGVNAQGRPIAKTVLSAAECHTDFKANSDEPTWNINLTYKPIPDVMLYAKYARGYRQGGINVTAIGLETWEPEKVDAYEIGAKTNFQGAVSGYFNISGFYNKQNNQQVAARTVPRVETGLTQSSTILNVGSATIKGVEVDASALLFDSLRLDVGYVYLDTRIRGVPAAVLLPGSPFTQVVPTVADGSALTFSPKNRVTASATYTLPLPEEVGKISLGATFTHTDSQIADVTALFGTLPATDLLNLNVTWNRVMGSPLDAAFFMTNVTNEIYAVATTQGSGYDNVLFGQPRIWGFRLRYNFGK
jgi:iron complex outermembrane receptor protein